jgi:hypothetical protein
VQLPLTVTVTVNSALSMVYVTLFTYSTTKFRQLTVKCCNTVISASVIVVRRCCDGVRRQQTSYCVHPSPCHLLRRQQPTPFSPQTTARQFAVAAMHIESVLDRYHYKYTLHQIHIPLLSPPRPSRVFSLAHKNTGDPIRSLRKIEYL